MGNRYGYLAYRKVILNIDMGYGLMIWETTPSKRSSPISIWDILLLCLQVPATRGLVADQLIVRAPVLQRPLQRLQAVVAQVEFESKV